MAKYVPEAPPSGPTVQGFVDGGFKVEGVVYPAVFLTPQGAATWDAPAPGGAFDAALAARVLALDPPAEFLLLGTGPRMAPPPPALTQTLDAAGIGIEAMDSRTAARTWNLLRGEGRWIVGALLRI